MAYLNAFGHSKRKNKHFITLLHDCRYLCSEQARSQDFFWGGAETKNVDLFGPNPLTPLRKTLFLVHFVTKSGPFGLQKLYF